jgi:hypothetical protein
MEKEKGKEGRRGESNFWPSGEKLLWLREKRNLPEVQAQTHT